MKKTLIAALGLFSLVAQANTNIQPAGEKQPKLALAIYDSSSKVPAKVEGLKYSVSKKNWQLCWTAFDMPFTANNKVTELFKSPAPAVFKSSTGSSVRSKDGKEHRVEYFTPSQNGELIQRCWTFDKNDPLGKYSLTLDINDVSYPPVSFELVK